MSHETARAQLRGSIDPAGGPTVAIGSDMEHFGPYRVGEQLGEGGMARVHRAVFVGIEGFERPVALKRMRGELAGDASFVRAFVREARLAAQLSHRNIAQIYDLGRIDDTYYIAMELLLGHDLLRVLRRMAGAGVGPMPVAVALEVLAQACDALEYAHRVLIHRDVSPANLIVGHDGVVRVIDFGIAKAATTSTLHTATGIVKGKFSYLPPEAITAAPLDGRADLFSLGVVAYELLTARPLFKGATDFATLEQIRDRVVPPPSKLNREVTAPVDALVLRALAKDPAKRWQSAAEMRAAIDAAREPRGAHVARTQLIAWLRGAMDLGVPPPPRRTTLLGWMNPQPRRP
jgi:serine/threonine-protein kinase